MRPRPSQTNIHSNKMTVQERIWRNGDLLYYQVTVTDPERLQEPWTMDTQVRRLNRMRPTLCLRKGTRPPPSTTVVHGPSLSYKC